MAARSDEVSGAFPENGEIPQKNGSLFAEENVPPVRIQVLQEATRLTAEDRNRSYGDPNDSFEEIAMIATILQGKPITKDDVAVIQIATKLVRQKYMKKGDNQVDGSAYLAIREEINAKPNGRKYSAVVLED